MAPSPDAEAAPYVSCCGIMPDAPRGGDIDSNVAGVAVVPNNELGLLGCCRCCSDWEVASPMLKVCGKPLVGPAMAARGQKMEQWI